MTFVTGLHLEALKKPNTFTTKALSYLLVLWAWLVKSVSYPRTTCFF
jgi:hypothetical protein